MSVLRFIFFTNGRVAHAQREFIPVMIIAPTAPDFGTFNAF